MSQLVFNREWIQTVEKRNGHLPRSQKSWPYLIATDGEFSPLRNQIENWVAIFSAATKEKIIPKLLSDENFWHTCHELVVGNHLKEIGFEVEFEKQLGEQTPDWFACSSDGSKSFIIEVFTANVSKSINSENKQLNELTRRLAEITLDFAIRISCEDDSVIGQLNPNRSKKIAEAVRDWLQSYDYCSEPIFSTGGLDFEVVGRNSGFTTLQYMEPVKSIYAPISLLRKKIKEKISIYKTLALTNKFPLVIAVAPGLETNYCNFEMKSILFEDVFSNLPVGNGLFVEEPLLSGVFFAWRTGMSEWAIRCYRNPNATFRLTEEVFNRLSVKDAFDPQFDFLVSR